VRHGNKHSPGPLQTAFSSSPVIRKGVQSVSTTLFTKVPLPCFFHDELSLFQLLLVVLILSVQVGPTNPPTLINRCWFFWSRRHITPMRLTSADSPFRFPSFRCPFYVVQFRSSVGRIPRLLAPLRFSRRSNSWPILLSGPLPSRPWSLVQCPGEHSLSLHLALFCRPRTFKNLRSGFVLSLTVDSPPFSFPDGGGFLPLIRTF